MFLGPLFRFELTRLARRGLQPRLRTIFVAFLLAGLAYLYIGLLPASMPYDEILAATPALPRNAPAKFGETFMLLYLTVQLVAVILFTPVYAAGSVIEEKNRKTLEFLQSSPITGREIILGKFFARIVFVLSILLAGLPVLMFAAFFGGVDPARLLYGFTIAIATAIFLGSHAMMEAMKSETLGRVLFRTYMMLAATTFGAVSCTVGGSLELTVLSAPTAFFSTVWFTGTRSTDPAVLVAVFAGLHLLASALFLRSAIRSVRIEIRQSPEPEPRSARNVAPTIAQIAHADPLFNIEVFTEIHLSAPPIGDSDNPIIWKETHFGSRVVRKGTGVETLMMMAMVFAIYPIALYLFVSLVKDLNDGVWIDRTINEVVMAFMELVLLGAPIVVGLRAAACIGVERQKETIIGLLTIPWSKREILSAKWWSAIRWVRGPLRGAAIALIVGTILVGVRPFAALATAVLLAGFLGFCTSMGLFFSIYRSSVMKATLAFLAVWFFALFGPFIIDTGLGVMISPAFALINGLALKIGATENYVSPAWSSLLLGLAYSALGWFVWRASVQRFEREGKE